MKIVLLLCLNSEKLKKNNVFLFLRTVLCPDIVFGASAAVLPTCATPLFANYPEWYVEDLAEFLLLALQHLPHIVARTVDHLVMTWLLTLVCSAQCFKNPYLVAKLVEVLFMMNPEVQVR